MLTLGWVCLVGAAVVMAMAASNAAAGPTPWMALGFFHIVPRGLDHILFVLGLYLLSPRWRTLLWQVTAFALAHSIGLALAASGVVLLSASVVEPLIALSIVGVALHNLFATDLSPARIAMVFVFGLIHGMGLAHALGEATLPAEGWFAALLSFNLGIELGQLAVLALAFGASAALRARAPGRRPIAYPASAAIAAVGVFWLVERTLL